jgi:hypothetical protein
MDVQPVPVHLTGVAPGVALGPAPAPKAAARTRTTRFSTYALTAANPVQNILAEDPDRIRATIIVNANIGGSTSTTSYGWLAGSRAVVTKAAADTGDGTTEGAAYVSNGGNTHTVFEFWGGGAVWGAQDNAASTVLALTVISDYEC